MKLLSRVCSYHDSLASSREYNSRLFSLWYCCSMVLIHHSARTAERQPQEFALHHLLLDI